MPPYTHLHIGTFNVQKEYYIYNMLINEKSNILETQKGKDCSDSKAKMNLRKCFDTTAICIKH